MAAPDVIDVRSAGRGRDFQHAYELGARVRIVGNPAQVAAEQVFMRAILELL
jgi:hypothetical protein